MIDNDCKRLLENAIICWNYMCLSQKIQDATSEKEKKSDHIIKNGSVVAWQQISLQREYDFSEEVLKDLIVAGVAGDLKWEVKILV